MQRVFFSVLPNPADTEIESVYAFQLLSHIGQLFIASFFDPFFQVAFHRIKNGDSPTFVREEAQLLETTIFVEPQPIGDRIDADTAQSGDLSVLLPQIFQLNAKETAEDLGVALILLASAQFFVGLGGEVDNESHRKDWRILPLYRFGIIKSN